METRLLRRVQRQAWFRGYSKALLVLGFTLICAVSLLSVFAIERADAQRRRLELDRNATEISAALERRATESMTYLRTGAVLFESREDVSRAEFRKFVDSLGIGRSMSNALGMGWAKRSDEGERGFPVVYLEPQTDGNRQFIGFDMYSDPVRIRAMDEATRRQSPVASGKLVLLRDRQQPQPGFLIYMPVFDPQPDGAPVLRGFVFSPFRATQFLAAASQLYSARGMNIALYDGEATPQNLLAAHLMPGPVGDTIEKHMRIANRPWVLIVGESQPSRLSNLSRLALLFAGVTTVLLLSIAWLIARRAIEDRQVLEWQQGQAAIRASLTRELNHRVKNTLANVLSIVALTRRRATDLDEFADSLTGRVRALSATHDLLTGSDWGTTSIEDLIKSELAPYMQDGENHVIMGGPQIRLAPNDALSLGLAMHELATNAAKYGALSVLEGKVLIQWRSLAPDIAEIEWRESAGPPVVAPRARGFGLELLEKIVPHDLRSSVDLRFEPEGVVCVLQFPVRETAEFSLRSRPAGAPPPSP